ncbi:hypothetical protein KSS87_023638, partial [Heliosperma pusillum]
MWDCSPENPFVESSCVPPNHGGCDEEPVKWGVLQRLPTYIQARTALFKDVSGDVSQVDITKLGKDDTSLVVDRLVAAFNNDPHLFFDKLKQRFNVVGLQFPKVEVRFEHLEVNAFVQVGTRALPTIPNFVFNMSEAFMRRFGIFRGKRMNMSILNDVSGIIRPSRLTLLLGPPSSGKTTLLLALAGRLGRGLKTSGKIRYNGYELNEFVPQRTSAYVSQRDWHMAEMTVRETIDFSGCCQGAGYKS